jgi:hypothetical protein
MRDREVVTRVAALTVAAGLVLAACTPRSSQSPSARTQPSTAPPVAQPVLSKLQQQTERFVHLHSATNPTAVTILASSRNLRPGQQGVVMTVRSIGNLLGSCRPEHPAVTFRVTYQGAGPPIVTEVRGASARPAGLHLLAPYWPPAPSPAGGKQQFAFIQVVAGGEAADFSLALWATLMPVPGGCVFSANGVLRVRCTAFANQICSYIARPAAWAHLG